MYGSRLASACTFAIATAVGLASPCAKAGGLPSFDLQSEFSTTSNPTGVWSYRHGAVQLPFVPAWQAALGGWSQPQPAWARSADGTNRLPMIFRSNGSETFAHDWTGGTVAVHSTDPGNGQGSGICTIAFTAPLSGVVSISGSTWLARDIGRSNDWRVKHAGTLLAAGNTSSGDPFSSANPFQLSAGETSPGSLSAVEVCAGEEILFEIERTPSSAAGDFSVLNCTVTYTVVFPECAADINGDCSVDGADLGQLLSNWGNAGVGDLNGSGSVDGADLGVLLGNWGPCPRG